MAHSYVSAVFHIVFSTKQRMQFIRTDNQSRLWNYLAGIARNHGMQVLAVGGTENHVHILVVLPADTALSDAVRTLKANSSRWMRETDRLICVAGRVRSVQRQPISTRKGQGVHRQSARPPRHAFV